MPGTAKACWLNPLMLGLPIVIILFNPPIFKLSLGPEIPRTESFRECAKPPALGDLIESNLANPLPVPWRLKFGVLEVSVLLKVAILLSPPLACGWLCRPARIESMRAKPWPRVGVTGAWLIVRLGLLLYSELLLENVELCLKIFLASPAQIVEFWCWLSTYDSAWLSS